MTGVSTSCGACKFLRRKCTIECVFAPYFSYDEAVAHFAAVHKVFGASNVSRLLYHLPEQFRGEAALTISFEAIARMRDPVYGCVAYIHALQLQVANLQEEIEVVGNNLAKDMSIGVASYNCGGFQATNMTNNNLLTYDSLPYFSEDQMMNLTEYWNNSSIINQVEEEPLILPTTHEENGSGSSQMMLSNNHMMMNLPVTFCEWEGQNLFYTGNNGPQECFVEGLLSPQTFDNSTLLGWLPNASSIL